MQIETWRLRYAEARVVFKLAGNRGGEWREPEKADRYDDGHRAADALDAMAQDSSVSLTLSLTAFALAGALRGAL